MKKNKVHEILRRGIYGAAETLPEERAFFLTTIRERIHLALTNRQVANRKIYPQAISLLKANKNLHLYVNGDLPYQVYSNYVKEATKYRVPFTIVNDGYDTPIGLVIASPKAITSPANDTLFIEDERFEADMNEA